MAAWRLLPANPIVVRVVQGGHRPGLALEAFAELLGGDLDGDRTVEPRVARPVHLARAAGSDGGEDFVRA